MLNIRVCRESVHVVAKLDEHTFYDTDHGTRCLPLQSLSIFSLCILPVTPIFHFTSIYPRNRVAEVVLAFDTLGLGLYCRFIVLRHGESHPQTIVLAINLPLEADSPSYF